MIDIDKRIMASMKAHDKVASETFKLLKAKMIEFRTAKNAGVYDEAAEVGIIKKMIAERKDSAGIYSANGRQDLADAENAQAEVLAGLLPPMPTAEDVVAYLDKYYHGGIKKKDMGMVIKEVKNVLVGVDGKVVAELVKERLV